MRGAKSPFGETGAQRRRVLDKSEDSDTADQHRPRHDQTGKRGDAVIRWLGFAPRVDILHHVRWQKRLWHRRGFDLAWLYLVLLHLGHRLCAVLDPLWPYRPAHAQEAHQQDGLTSWRRLHVCRHRIGLRMRLSRRTGPHPHLDCRWHHIGLWLCLGLYLLGYRHVVARLPEHRFECVVEHLDHRRHLRTRLADRPAPHWRHHHLHTPHIGSRIAAEHQTKLLSWRNTRAGIYPAAYPPLCLCMASHLAVGVFWHGSRPHQGQRDHEAHGIRQLEHHPHPLGCRLCLHLRYRHIEHGCQEHDRRPDLQARYTARGSGHRVHPLRERLRHHPPAGRNRHCELLYLRDLLLHLSQHAKPGLSPLPRLHLRLGPRHACHSRPYRQRDYCQQQRDRQVHPLGRYRRSPAHPLVPCLGILRAA